MMTRRCWILGSAGCAGGTLLAQTREAKGKAAVEAALAALGGARFMAMRDRTENGRAYSFYRDQLSGRSHARFYTRYLTRPEPPRIDFFGLRERQSFGKDKEESAVLFTETEGWSITYRGARPIGKEIEDRFRDSTRRNIFYMLRQRMGEPGMIIEQIAEEVVENKPAKIVTITDSDNRVVKVFFHTSTGLPFKQEYFRRDAKTRERIEEVSYFSKYRDAGGVQWPLQIEKQRNGEKLVEIFSDTVQINKDLKEDLFTLPTTMKVLPQAR
ncbi:MAG: hypothetical protein HY820_05000 [Acidobacteria bacterium]|nr:hypothetical protein [Acidobacteriota bacterium]